MIEQAEEENLLDLKQQLEVEDGAIEEDLGDAGNLSERGQNQDVGTIDQKDGNGFSLEGEKFSPKVTVSRLGLHVDNGDKEGAMIEAATIVDTLHYILSRVKKSGKIKLIKLVYLADKYHLLRYGRTVTNDDYYAMELGPVGTTVKDVLSLDEEMLGKEYKYISRLIGKDGVNYIVKPVSHLQYDHLSDTDKEALDFVIDMFGNKTGAQLTTYTHKYPEWAQHAHLFTGKDIRRVRIEPEELLSVIDDNCFNVSPEHVEESRKMITGVFH